MRNVIDCIKDIIYYKNISINTDIESSNRINAEGEGLEKYIKAMFAGTYQLEDGSDIQRAISSTFSGIQKNSHPDMFLRGGDTIEIKKIEGIESDLNLNSTYPHDRIYYSKSFEKKLDGDSDWESRDLLYIIGHLPKKSKKIKSLFFIYGSDYCADKKIYEKLKQKIKKATQSAKNEDKTITFKETKEIARISKVDPLERTDLRVRGMWVIQNPYVVFKRYYSLKHTLFNLIAIIDDNKIKELGNFEELIKISRTDSKLEIKDIIIPDPNNEVKSINAKLIQYSI